MIKQRSKCKAQIIIIMLLRILCMVDCPYFSQSGSTCGYAFKLGNMAAPLLENKTCGGVLHFENFVQY